MRRSLIVATSTDGTIGSNGRIPWVLPNDLKRFKALTMGHHIIMGRKTHISIGKPLPGRKTVVLSRGGGAIPFTGSVFHATSLEAALALAQEAGDEEPFICGGGQIYEEAMSAGLVDRIYKTVVEIPVRGDAHFHLDIYGYGWKRIEVEHVEEDGALSHRFEIWERA